MKVEDVALSIIADAQQQNAFSEVDLHECVRTVQRAIVFLEAGKYGAAMAMCGNVATVALQAQRRIEVAASTRRAAERILEAKR